MRPLRLALVASEAAPFAKTGGLGDVAGALTRYLADAGHDVRLFLPYHSTIDLGGQAAVPVDFLHHVPVQTGVRSIPFTAFTTPLPGTDHPVYLIGCPELYDRPRIYSGDADDARRYAYLARAAIECCQRMGFAPDVFHVHDWHAALVPVYLRSLYGWDRLFTATRTLLTIHNVGFQGAFPTALLPDVELSGHTPLLHQEDLHQGRFAFLTTGILHADLLTTVSPTHAREIQSEEYGMGLAPLLRQRSDRLVGILNGIDEEVWSPERDRLLPHRYSADDLSGKAGNKAELLERMGLPPGERVPTLGIVSRLTAQKGFELAFDCLPHFLANLDLRLVVLGTGEETYERFFAELEQRFPGKVSYHRGFSEELAHLIEAGADVFLMPSRYEPCGLNQMYSLRYGTPPVVRKTGGLADAVELWDPHAGTGDGFVFEHFTADALAWAIDYALQTYDHPEAWRRVMRNGMRKDNSWRSRVGEYVALYRRLVES